MLEKIDLEIKEIYKEWLLANKQYNILINIMVGANENKYKQVLIPIIDSLSNSIIIKLNNIFYPQDKTINLPYIIDKIEKSNSLDNSKINKWRLLLDNNQFYIKKLFIIRSTKYGHLSIKVNTSNKKYSIDNTIFLNEISILLQLGLDIINQVYISLFNKKIAYSEKDDEIIKIEIEKIKSILKGS